MNKLISGFSETPLRKKNERKESEYLAGKKELFYSIGIYTEKQEHEKNVKRDWQPTWLHEWLGHTHAHICFLPQRHGCCLIFLFTGIRKPVMT